MTIIASISTTLSMSSLSTASARCSAPRVPNFWTEQSSFYWIVSLSFSMRCAWRSIVGLVKQSACSNTEANILLCITINTAQVVSSHLMCLATQIKSLQPGTNTGMSVVLLASPTLLPKRQTKAKINYVSVCSVSIHRFQQRSFWPNIVRMLANISY